MNELPMRPGTLVRSLAGRDKDTCYVVIRIVSERFVAVADGVNRPVDRPKTKNRKHLAVVGMVDEPLRARLQRGERVTDGDVEEALRAISHA